MDELEIDPAVDHPAEAASPSRPLGALAGFLGAAAALVVIELVSLVDATGVSVTETIQHRFIVEFAASLKQVAIEWFGQNDKVALRVGTAIVVLALGAAAGAVARDRWRIVAGVFAAFAVAGTWVGWNDPQASRPVLVAAAALGAVVGAAVAIGLERRWRLPVGANRGTASGTPALSRRTVLVSTGATAAVLVAGAAVARAARGSLRSAATTVSKALPKPSRTVAVPADQPFEVEGLTPYVVPRADFYRIDTADPVPVVDPDGWELRITGRVDRELSFTYDELLARKDLVELPVTLSCVSNEVGGDLVGNARWTGVPLATLLREVGVQEGADQVMSESVDGFTAGFPLEVALDGRDALVAVGMNGSSLPPVHGFPARLVVPGLYGYVSATKWLSEIRLTTFDDELGFWIPRGWSRLGPVKTESRIDVPSPGAGVSAGTVAVAGVAWAPTRGIEKVEVQVDDGPWRQAELGRVASADTWVQWHLAWKATSGPHTLRVRATDGEGNRQTSIEAPPPPDGASGHHTITLDVT